MNYVEKCRVIYIVFIHKKKFFVLYVLVKHECLSVLAVSIRIIKTSFNVKLIKKEFIIKMFLQWTLLFKSKTKGL